MGLFQEYLNSKGKIDKPVVAVVANRVDPMTPPNSPPKEGNLFGATSDGKSIGHYAQKGGKPDGKKGFGDQGHSSLKYCPDVVSSKSHASKLPVAEQAELCSVVTDAIKKDPTVVSQLIYQLKAEGMMGALVAEMLQHKITYENMVELMGHDVYGKSVCNKLMRAMSEEVAPQFSDSIAGNGASQKDTMDDNLDDDDLDDDDLDLDDNEEGDENSIEGIQAKIAELKQKLADMGVDPDADPNSQDPNAGMDPNMGSGAGPAPDAGAGVPGAAGPTQQPLPMMKSFMARYMNRY